jgi:predicted DNA-binding transcriptional regulator AlpA
VSPRDLRYQASSAALTAAGSTASSAVQRVHDAAPTLGDHESAEVADSQAAQPADRPRAGSADDEYLTFPEVADWLRCSTRTVQRLLETGTGPPVIRLSERRLIFRKSDVRHWLARRTTGPIEAITPARRSRRREGANNRGAVP